MIRVVAMLVLVMLTSMYFFPFEFSFLPGINTKMMLAGAGLVCLIVNIARRGERAGVDSDLFRLSMWAFAISVISLAAVVYNNTTDFTYASYLVSMWVWLGGGYAVTQAIKMVHGHINIRLVCHYLIAVCFAQCVVAYMMGQVPELKDFVDSFLGSSGFMGKVEDRLYGIGASLDVAGMRFAAILIIIAYLCINKDSENENSRNTLIIYVFTFLIIAYIGNMIGRTTTVGIIIALLYLVYVALGGTPIQKHAAKEVWLVLLATTLVFLPIIIYSYNTDTAVHNNIRFAYEGFFSLAEKGRWETHSNEILKDMYVFPDNAKTWLIGDGYFDNPIETDPYYIGRIWNGFYHGTDVGYLRFIFYFGVTGMVCFLLYMCNVAWVCMKRQKSYSVLFAILLALNFIVWLKVSSDLFPVFAIFLCIINERQPLTATQEMPDERKPQIL